MGKAKFCEQCIFWEAAHRSGPLKMTLVPSICIHRHTANPNAKGTDRACKKLKPRRPGNDGQ